MNAQDNSTTATATVNVRTYATDRVEYATAEQMGTTNLATLAATVKRYETLYVKGTDGRYYTTGERPYSDSFSEPSNKWALCNSIPHDAYFIGAYRNPLTPEQMQAAQYDEDAAMQEHANDL